MTDLSRVREKAGYSKLEGSCELAGKQGYDYLWKYSGTKHDDYLSLISEASLVDHCVLAGIMPLSRLGVAKKKKKKVLGLETRNNKKARRGILLVRAV